ncbi:MAG TPA: autotransporter-associated beta strand repeat-containing protein, partial [Gemmataceae bacterium]|nr:autotransporter-associated beta strand repeat-containing protein [Gemmataceae bacterium]
GLKSSFTLGTTPTDTGVLTVNAAFNLGNIVSTTATAHASRATFTINGGTATINADINAVNSNPNTSTVTLTSILNLNGGTINVTGHQIGHAGAGTFNITTVNMPAGGQTATLANLGGSGINDAGLNMTGAGTLVLAGTNTYTGPTTVTSGTLALAPTATVASPVITVGTAPGNPAVLDVSAITGGFQVGSGQTLAGHGTVLGSSTIAGGATLAPGSSVPGTLTVSTGTHTWSPGGNYNFVYDPSATPPGPVQGGNNDLLQAASGTNAILNLSSLGTGPGQRFNLALIPGSGTPVGGAVTYTIADFSPSSTPSPIMAPSGFSGTNLTPYFNVTGAFQGTPSVSLANGNQVQVTFTPVPVPEPALILLACGGVAGLFARCRRTSMPA